jgi:SAM-dependent methyltransferase
VFIEAAAGADPDRDIAYVLGDGAVLPFRPSSFDLVTAFMSLMDVADPERTFDEIARVLRPGGTLQFSVLHPVSSTPVRRWVKDDAGQREALAIGGYFHEGAVTESWTFSAAPLETQARHRPFEMVYARRTLAGWINAVTDAGFAVQQIDEPHADDATAAEHPEVADTRIVPYSLIVRAVRT